MYVIEVMITDQQEEEHIYWVEMRDEFGDEDDAIDRAIQYHATTDAPPPMRMPADEIDDDWTQIPAIMAGDPFDLEEDQYTMIPLDWSA